MLDDILKKLCRDSHILQVKKADFYDGMAQLVEEFRLGRGVSGQFQVQDGNGCEGHDEDWCSFMLCVSKWDGQLEDCMI